MYPVTDLALNAQRVMPVERREIKMWSGRASPGERSLVRWIRDPRDKEIYVFVAEPERPREIIAWVALNTNMAIDVHQCTLHAVPGA